MNTCQSLTIEEKYNKMIESQKQAHKKYYEKNKETINEVKRKYYNETLRNNEEYRAKKSEYNRKRYLAKKNTEV